MGDIAFSILVFHFTEMLCTSIDSSVEIKERPLGQLLALDHWDVDRDHLAQENERINP